MGVTRDDLLFVSFYYRPDLSAGSFRATALVQALHRLRPNLRVRVLTTLPNRYHSFTADAEEFETVGNVTVERIRMPPHRSGMVDQARAFSHFAREVRRRARGAKPRCVLATSSRLMTAALGAAVARDADAPLVLDIRDIFVDTIGDVLRGPIRAPMLPVLNLIERWALRRATLVNLVSKGFEPWFRGRYPNTRLTFYSNGVDDEFLTPRTRQRLVRGPMRITYAGNMGEGQGLEHILPGLAKRLGASAQIRVIGDGGRRAQLQAAVLAEGVDNVQLLDPIPRDALIQEYADSDVLFLHLNDYAAFTKVLPSKIFEYGASQRPILAGVSGYAATFLNSEVSNSAVFAPCDVNGAVAALASLRLETTPRDGFIKRFARDSIMSEFANDVLAVIDANHAPR